MIRLPHPPPGQKLTNQPRCEFFNCLKLSLRLIVLQFLFHQNVLQSQVNADPEVEQLDCNCPSGYASVTVNGTGAGTTISSIYPSTNSVSNTCLFVSGLLIIDKNFDFTSCHFFMSGASKIQVINNYKIGIFSNTTLQGCTQLWSGIQLINNSYIVAKDSRIQDARYAINNEGSSGSNAMFITNTKFYDNVIGIYAPASFGGGRINIGPGFIKNIFRGNRALLSSPPSSGAAWTNSGDYSYAGMVIYNSHFSLGVAGSSIANANKFIRLQAGICTYDNIATIQTCYFENILSSHNNSSTLYYSTGVRAGSGIYSGTTSLGEGTTAMLMQVGFGKNGSLSFSNVTNAIVESGGVCNVSENNMYQVANGITLSNSSSIWIGHIFNSINNNKIIFDNTGIYAYSNNSVEVNIQLNELIMGSGSKFGLYLLNNLNCNLFAKANTITSGSGTVSAIYVNYSPAKLINNSVNLSSGLSNRHGIHVTDSENSILSCNGVTGNGGTSSTAFWIGSSEMVNMECNQALSCGTGYYFSGSCQNLSLQTNDYNNCSTGLRLNPVAMISDQIEKGNQYLGSFSIGARHDGSDFYIDRSKFKVSNTNQIDYPKGNLFQIYTPFGTPGSWFFTPGDLPTCNLEEDLCYPFPPSLNNLQDHTIAAWPSNEELFNTTSKYNAQAYLWNKLNENPSIKNGDSILQTFYLSHYNAEIGTFVRLRNSFRSAFQVDSAEIQEIDSFNENIIYWIDSLISWDQSFGGISEYTVISDINTRDSIIFILDNLSDSITSIYQVIATNASDLIDSILTVNNNFSTSDPICLKEKQFNQISYSLKVEFRDTLCLTEALTLDSLSNLCCFEYGNAILAARALLSVYELQSQDDESLCDFDNFGSQSIQNRSNQYTELSIYPNPVNDLIKINAPKVDEIFKIALLSLNGQLFYEADLVAPFTINTTEIKSGLYFLRLTRNNNITYFRILIQH